MAMASPLLPSTPTPANNIRAAVVVVVVILAAAVETARASTATWCVARSDASVQALQTALDYACGTGGADCAPLQSSGLCFLPNTIQAHASYAFNSYYQRRSMAPGSCDFSSTATVAQSDPSYGSCVYPSSLSTAGGSTQGTASTNNPTTLTPTTTTPGLGNGGVGVNPGLTPTIPDISDDGSRASPKLAIPKFVMMLGFLFVTSLLIFS